MPQFERELTEEEGRKQNEIWENWLKNKPVQQKQPSDFLNDMFNPENKSQGDGENGETD